MTKDMNGNGTLKLNYWLKMATLITLLMGPMLAAVAYVFNTEMEKKINDALDCKNIEHERIKRAILNHHYDEETINLLYPTRGGSTTQ